MTHKIKNADKAIAVTVANGSNAVALPVSAAFNAGRDFHKAGASAAESLRHTVKERQDAAKADFRSGVVAAILYASVDVTPDLVATVTAIFAKKGKERSKAEFDACRAADQRMRRLMLQYGIPNLETKGGKAKAAKTKAQIRDAKIARVLKDVEAVMGPAKRAALEGKLPVTGKATPLVPTIETLADMQAHMALVTKSLSSTLAVASVKLPTHMRDLYRTAISDFTAAIRKLDKLPFKAK